jgi:ferredoxin-NADP reductase
MRVRLRCIRWEAEGINSYILEALAGESLPPFDAGAHIDVQLSPGLARSYSLVNDPAYHDYYEIAVHHAIEGRGGSKHIHKEWRVGHILEISAPKNNFPLTEDAVHTVMIAGGIGITPMLPMIARLEALGKTWELHYVAASPGRAAYVQRVQSLGDVKVAFDGIEGGQRLDLKAIINRAPHQAHLYCCGPTGMLDAFVALSSGRPKGHAHIEYFSADTELATGGGYTLELSKSGKSVAVEEGETMLDA